MSSHGPTLDALVAFLHDLLGADAYPADERGGVFRLPPEPRAARTHAIGRLGLALEPWPGLSTWAAHEGLGALFLHRPWRLAPSALPRNVGVVFSHLPFDEHLTTGDNAPLAGALGFRTREVLGTKHGRPIGMIGDVAPVPAAEAVAHVARVIGGTEEIALPDARRPVARVAVVGAMTDALVREAARRGVGLYVTGQMRQPARAAVSDTGMAVAAVGHARSEQWGLGALAELLRARWPTLELLVADSAVAGPATRLFDPGESVGAGRGERPHR